jgi:hypothetical protein
MTNLQKKLEKWEKATYKLADEFGWYYSETGDYSVSPDGLLVEVEDYLLNIYEVVDYISDEATREEFIAHQEYCINHPNTEFNYWRSEIKPKTEPQPVEVRVIKNDQL